jgi:hypothetical protein
MTKVLTVLLAGLLSFSAFASIHAPTATEKARSNDILRFIAESGFLRDVALHSLINTRCERYAVSKQVANDCSYSVAAMLDLLDYDLKIVQSQGTPNSNSWKPEAFVFIAFKKNFLELMKSPKTGKYLQKLNEELSAVIFNPTHKFSIWDFTIKFYGSEELATTVIASLFQDTSMLMLHVQYLDYIKYPGNNTYQANRTDLIQVIQLINQILDTSEDNFGHLFYPKQFQNKLNRSIYHFFVPLYLAQTLKSHGFSTLMSKTTPFMLTLTYEFITASEGYDYLFNDPAYLDSRKHDWKLKDIYGGYCGSHFAMKEKSFKNFSDMSSRFDQSTVNSVKFLLK